MATAYVLSDTLPRDASNRSFAGLVNTASSDLDFALQKGIGASTISSKIQAHLAVATHTQGSVIENGHPGVVGAGVYLDDHAASVAGNGQAILFRMSKYGALHTEPRAKTYAARNTSGASTYTVLTGSANVFKFNVTFAGGSAADSVILKNGTEDAFHIVNASENEQHHLDLDGVYFASGIKIDFATISQGAASATVVYQE